MPAIYSVCNIQLYHKINIVKLFRVVFLVKPPYWKSTPLNQTYDIIQVDWNQVNIQGLFIGPSFLLCMLSNRPRATEVFTLCYSFCNGYLCNWLRHLLAPLLGGWISEWCLSWMPGVCRRRITRYTELTIFILYPFD